MLVSIIIPCYNAERFVTSALESALNQTYRNIEVIAVDDGSTDNSFGVLEKYKSRIILIKQTNQGGNVARNKGLEHAKGELIKFLDADDVLYENAIEEQIKSYHQLQDDSNKVVYGEVDFIDENGKIIRRNKQPKFADDNQLVVLIEKAIITSSPLYLKKHLEEVGGLNNTLKGNQEHELNLRLALSGKKFIYFPFSINIYPDSWLNKYNDIKVF